LSEQAKFKLKFCSSSDAPIAWVAGRRIFLKQFKRTVLSLVEHIQRAGEGDVLISTTGRYSFSVALLAAWIAHRNAILPPDNHPATLKRVYERHKIGCEFNQQWGANLVLEHEPDLSATRGTWLVELAFDTDAVSIYTSGSSGVPVLLKKSLGNLLHEAGCLQQTLDWPGGAIVGTVPPQHLYGLSFTVLLPWVAGLPWVDDIPLYPQDLAQVLSQTGATTLVSVPAHYKALIHDDFPSNSLFAISAAAPLDELTATHWQARNGHAIQEIYGSSETGVVAHRRQLESPQWQAFSSVDVSVNKGLLKVRSSFIYPAWGYEFQSSDKAKLCAAEKFELYGRSDSIVKIGGKRISLQEIERSLLECTGVSEVAALVVPVDSHVRDSAVWVAVAGAEALSISALRTQLREKLAGTSIPRRLLVVDKLPRNASGKVPQRLLKALFRDNDSSYV